MLENKNDIKFLNQLCQLRERNAQNSCWKSNLNPVHVRIMSFIDLYGPSSRIAVSLPLIHQLSRGLIFASLVFEEGTCMGVWAGYFRSSFQIQNFLRVHTCRSSEMIVDKWIAFPS